MVTVYPLFGETYVDDHGKKPGMNVVDRVPSVVRSMLGRAACTEGLSDLHVVPVGESRARIGGRLKPATALFAETSASAVLEGCVELLTGDERMQLNMRGDVTIRLPLENVVARIKLYKTLGSIGAAVRILQSQVPKFKDLLLPASIASFAEEPAGLIIFTGPVGAGKTTALNSIVDRMDELKQDRHVRIIETPQEYVHLSRHILVTPVTVGVRKDAETPRAALEAALGCDAQVIIFGEAIDGATVRAAVEAAYGTGALIALSVHGTTQSSAIGKLLDSFAGESESVQKRVVNMFAEVYRGGASLRLVPRIDRVGRIAAAEVVKSNSRIAAMIRSGDFQRLADEQNRPNSGMQTLEGDLERLISAGVIDREDATLAAALN